MVGEKIRWMGISILGGNSGVEGPFELGLDSIRAVNKEDVTTTIRA
jgi:NADH dehydrogenase [ubiquinone] 1 alpha subcomplex assembly factor 1